MQTIDTNHSLEKNIQTEAAIWSCTAWYRFLKIRQNQWEYTCVGTHLLFKSTREMKTLSIKRPATDSFLKSLLKLIVFFANINNWKNIHGLAITLVIGK